jgi:hypothetical protein
LVAARHNHASQHIAQQIRAYQRIFKLRVGDYFAIWISNLDHPVAVDCDAFMVALGSAFAWRNRGRLGLSLARCSGGFGCGLSRSARRLGLGDGGHAGQENKQD